jgi:hypothetical protein
MNPVPRPAHSSTAMMRRFRLQYASNLFITKHAAPVFPHFLIPRAPHLALVGNIGHPHDPRFSHFFDWASRRWDTIIYVPGHLEQPYTNQAYEYLKHHSNIHMLTPKQPFFLFQQLPIALWTPHDDPPTLYRKLFLFSYHCHDKRICLESHGTIYSHNINGHHKDTYTNSRGHEEHPAPGFSQTAIIDLAV